MLLVSLEKISHALVFVWILAVVTRACEVELKDIDKQITIPCSSSPDDDQITWNFTQTKSL